MKRALRLVQAVEIQTDFYSFRQELRSLGYFDYPTTRLALDFARFAAIAIAGLLLLRFNFNSLGLIVLLFAAIDLTWWLRGFLACLRRNRVPSSVLLSTEFIGNVFEQTHNIREKGKVLNWISGGLNHQIEHRLFPDMPSQNYRKISREVKIFATYHGLPYLETTVGSMLKSQY